jgi:hypothetical protein
MLLNEERGNELAQELVQIQGQIDLLLLQHSVLAAEYAGTQHWDDAGFNTPIDWLRFNCHLTEKVAADRIAVGEEVSRLTQRCTRWRPARSASGIWQ